MKFGLFIPILVAALGFSSAVAFPTAAQAQNRSRNNPSNQATAFQCIAQGRGFATVAVRGTKRSNPMIMWESHAFGSQYTPQHRCRTVSNKLTRAVAQNGGRLTKLLLTTGLVNGQTVICYVNTGVQGCNPSNTLFTLKPENAKNPGAALASVLRFGRYGSGSALRESVGEEEDAAVDLEAAVEEAFAIGRYESADEHNDLGSTSESTSTRNSLRVEPIYAPNP